MATDYISREAVVRFLEACSGGYDYIETEKEGAINVIKLLPAADVRPVVRAHWKPAGGSVFPMFSCTNCSAISLGGNFCPTCGADMREVHDA